MPRTDFALRTISSACLSTQVLLDCTAPRSDRQSFCSDRPRRYSLQKLGCIPLRPDMGSLGSRTHKTSCLRLQIRHTCTREVLQSEGTPSLALQMTSAAVGMTALALQVRILPGSVR